MSTIDLLVLGILLKNAINAYEVVRFTRENEIHRILKISEPAIFKSCRRLAEAGYLDGETVRTAGVPDKVVYTVNEQGRQRFYELMSHFAQEFKPFYLDFNTVLWNIDNVDKAEGTRMLLTLQTQLHMAKAWITQHDAEVKERLAFGPRQIVKQYRMTITTLSDWIDEAIDEYV